MPQLLYASQMVYPTAIMTAKLSILSLYWRLFPTRFMKRGCVILTVLTLMWWIAGVLVDIFQCSPVSKAFNPAMSPEGCIDQNAYCMGSKQFPNTIPNHSPSTTDFRYCSDYPQYFDGHDYLVPADIRGFQAGKPL